MQHRNSYALAPRACDELSSKVTTGFFSMDASLRRRAVSRSSMSVDSMRDHAEGREPKVDWPACPRPQSCRWAPGIRRLCFDAADDVAVPTEVRGAAFFFEILVPDKHFLGIQPWDCCDTCRSSEHSSNSETKKACWKSHAPV